MQEICLGLLINIILFKDVMVKEAAFLVLGYAMMCFRSVVPNLGPPDVLGLQLPEILASTGGGEGFWEL